MDIPLEFITKTQQLSNCSSDYLWTLFLQQNKKCALSGVDLDLASLSLDQIDFNLGDIEGNLQWIHQDLKAFKNKFSTQEFLEWCRKCFLNQYKGVRPFADEFFMMLAFTISERSEDLHIKHGAVIVNKLTNHIIGTGYNGTIRGSDKSQIDLSNREKRRPWMIHAEENAIMNCTENPLNLKRVAIYITGTPCINCLQRIINFGITEIYVAKRMGSITENAETMEMREKILKMFNIEIQEIPIDNFWVKKVYYGS